MTTHPTRPGPPGEERTIRATEPRSHWWDWFTWPRAAISDIQADTVFLRRGALEINDRLKTLEAHVADVSPVLSDLAQKLRDLAAPASALIEENRSLRAQLAAHADADAAEVANESAAAADLTDGYNTLAAAITGTPDAPNVDPLPAPDEPAAPVTDPTDPDSTPAA